MNVEILEKIRLCDDLLYRYNKDTSNKCLYKEYCKIRNCVHRYVKNAKATFLSDKIE